MCGIAGWLDTARASAEEEMRSITEAMTDRIAPRGPDAEGSWFDPAAGIAFGHRRLSIVDLSELGAQPMHSASGRYLITYNGELYNHRELAADLAAAGVAFRGHSDTEVLLAGIEQWGLVAALDRADGMWAFALWDRQTRSLTLVRDRMGEKPLYYGRLGRFVAFGSSLDSLRAHPAFDRPIDRDALALYLRFKYVPEDHTIFEGVHQLPPGHLLEIAADGTLSPPQAYWRYVDHLPGAGSTAPTPTEAVDELDRLLRRSVARRMVADVPVGAFLSGGLDSSTVVAAAQATSTEPVHTFTIGFDDPTYDESSDARAVAERLGTRHTELRVTGRQAIEVVGLLPTIYDEPFADSSQVPTRLVSELARREVTVALSGDAGDELFGGYNRYSWVPAIWSRLGRLPLPARRALGRGLREVRPDLWDRAGQLLPASRRPRQLGLKIAKVAGVVDAPDAEEVFHRLCSHWLDPAALVAGSTEPPVLHTDRARWPATPGIVEHMMAIDALTYLPDDVLRKVDRASMSVGLEARVPLLDRSIVEFAAGLPTDLKLRDGTSKWLLRQVLSRSIPLELVDRPKAGFGMPIEDWLRGPLRPWAEEHLFGPAASAFLDLAPVRAAWADHLAGRSNRAYELWDVAMFGAWADHRGITA